MKKVSILVILLALVLTACTAPVATDMAMEEGDASAGEAAATEEPAEESAADEAEASTEDAASRPSRLTGAAPSTQAEKLPFVAGNSMVRGQKYVSESGNHYLIFQPDGNLVIYTADDRFFWGLQDLTKEYQQAETVQMEAGGNFVVRGPDNKQIWSALQATPDASASLTLTSDGALQLVAGGGDTLWSSTDRPFDAPDDGTFPFAAGRTLTPREKYFSKSGNHYLVFQLDGNLVVYTADDKFVWGLNEITDKFQQAETVQMEADGNLVVRAADNTAVWSALQGNLDPGASLSLTSKGALQIASPSRGVIWSSDGILSETASTSDAAQPETEESVACGGYDYQQQGDRTVNVRQISGWQVYVNCMLLEQESEKMGQVLTLLEAKLNEITRVVPEEAVVKLKTIPLWFSPQYDNFEPRAEYHPNETWLKENGRNPAMWHAVEFTNTSIFEEEMDRGPMVVLHELAHGYHDLFVQDGNNNQEIINAYTSAKAGSKYNAVERRHGTGIPTTTEEAYAMTNEREYFSESTEAYFGQNDFYPFTRSDLLQEDPDMAALLTQLWGVSTQQ